MGVELESLERKAVFSVEDFWLLFLCYAGHKASDCREEEA